MSIDDTDKSDEKNEETRWDIQNIKTSIEHACVGVG